MGKRGPPAKPTQMRRRPGHPRVCPGLERLGLLTAVDRAVLAGYCQAYARWRQAEEAIEKYGLIGQTLSGYVQQLPYVSIANQALKQMRACAAEFGFSPASRTRIAHPEPKTEDDFEDFLSDAEG